jgi:hypothetical protein
VAQALTNVQGAERARGRAAQGFAVDGDVLDAGQTGDATQPRQAAGLQGAGLEGGEDALEGVVRRDAAGQAQEAPGPALALFGKEGDVRPVVAVGDHAAQSHHEQVNEPRGSWRRRKCFLMEATEGGAAMQYSGKWATSAESYGCTLVAIKTAATIPVEFDASALR